MHLIKLVTFGTFDRIDTAPVFRRLSASQSKAIFAYTVPTFRHMVPRFATAQDLTPRSVLAEPKMGLCNAKADI